MTEVAGGYMLHSLTEMYGKQYVAIMLRYSRAPCLTKMAMNDQQFVGTDLNRKVR